MMQDFKIHNWLLQVFILFLFIFIYFIFVFIYFLYPFVFFVFLLDGGFDDIVKRIKQDPEFERAVDIIGVHYPGTISPNSAIETGKQLWASEGLFFKEYKKKEKKRKMNVFFFF